MNGKLISAGVGGLVVGALVGGAAATYFAEKKTKAIRADQEDMAQALLEKSEQIRSLTAEINTLRSAEPSDVEINTGGEIEEVNETPDTEPTDEEFEESRAQLQALIEPYVSGSEMVDEFVQKTRKIRVGDVEPPEVISKQLYSWDPDGPGDEYEKTTLTWYPRHRILLDEDQELVETADVAAMVGFKNLNRFGDESEDPLVVYIRNHRLATDFEVILEEDEDPPIHVQLGMPKEEYETNRAAGLIKFRASDV